MNSISDILIVTSPAIKNQFERFGLGLKRRIIAYIDTLELSLAQLDTSKRT